MLQRWFEKFLWAFNIFFLFASFFFFFGMKLYHCWNPSNQLLCVRTDYSCCPPGASYKLFSVPFQACRGLVFDTKSINSLCLSLYLSFEYSFVTIIYLSTFCPVFQLTEHAALVVTSSSEYNMHKFYLHKHVSKQQDSIISLDDNSTCSTPPSHSYHFSLFPLISFHAGT